MSTEWVNPYVKTLWVDHLIDPNVTDPLTGEPFIIQEGTRFTAARANKEEEGIYDLYNLYRDLQVRATRLETKVGITDRTTGDKTFFDPLDGHPAANMTLDMALADLVQATTSGATVLNVDKPEQFLALTEITVYDDVNSEESYITAINLGAKTITVTPALTKVFKKGAKVARSNIAIDATTSEMNVSTWGTYTISMTEAV